MRTLRFTRRTAPQDWLDYDDWEPVSTEHYDELARRRLSLLTDAVKDYIDGNPFDSELEKEGIYRQTLLRCFNRCITPDGTGGLFGWRGLIPGIRVRAPERVKPLVASGRSKRGGLSGALTLFLRQHERIASDFESYLLASAKRASGHEARLRQKSAHQKFIELCNHGGVQEYEWPLSTRRKGSESIRKHVVQFLEYRYDDIVATQFGERAKARSHTGTGYESRLTACRPFDIVEIDEHKCGFIGSIGVMSPEGMRWLPIERVTIILVVERRLRLILGYKAIFRREADADDVLDVLNSATGNGIPQTHFEGYEVAPAAGLPSELGGIFTWCGFNQVLFDNALIHLATEVSDRARAIIGCDLNFGPVRRFERRATVENVFGGLERLGFRRLPSTVGTSPQDPIRQLPEKEAGEAKLTVQQVMDLIASVIVEHNRSKSKSNFGSNPLARLESTVRNEDGLGVVFPVLPPLAHGVAGLDVSVIPLSIHGSELKGRRPYFTFEGEEYTGTDIARNWSLVGKQVFGNVTRSDLREIIIFSSSGAFIDTAKVKGRWRHTKHSRETRKHINSLIKDGYLNVGYSECPVHRFLESLMDRVRRDGKSTAALTRKDLSIVAAEQLARAEAAAVSSAFTAEQASVDTPTHGATPGTDDISRPGVATEQTDSTLPSEVEDDYLDFEGIIAFGGTAS